MPVSCESIADKGDSHMSFQKICFARMLSSILPLRARPLDLSKPTERGQGLTEYAVLISLVGVACIAAMALFGGALQGRISSLVAAIAGEDRSRIEEGNATARSASEKLRTRSKKVDGMKVNTDQTSGEVIDTESLQ